MNSPKVILQLIESWGPGGAENVVLDLCSNLDRNLFYPIAIVCRDGWLSQQLLKKGIETIILKDRYSYDILFLNKLIGIIKKRKVSIIHSHEFFMNVYATMAAILTKKPIITTIHGMNYYWEKLRRRVAYRIMSHFAKKVVAVSEHQKKFICNKTGINPNKIFVIYNGVDLDKFNGNNFKPKNNIDSKEKLEFTKPVIGTVGNLYPVKGHIYLLKAMKNVVEMFPSITLIIIGKITTYLDTLKKEAKNLNIEKNIKFLGFREDIPDLLKLMDIFVLPSLSEAHPLSLIEAMACKKPVIATNVGGIPEVIDDGINGLLVPAANPDALAKKIVYLLNNYTLANNMAQKGYDKIQQQFSLKSMLSKYEEIYSNLIFISYKTKL